MPIRVGFAGIGHVHTGSYLHEIRNDSDCAKLATLVGFYDRDPELAKSFGAQNNLPAFASYHELLDVTDAIIICAPNAQHRSLALPAFESKKHVLCEKPLSTTLKDGEEMVAAANRAGVNFMTGFPCRFSPAYASLKARIARNDIGKIISISATNRGRCPFGWFVDKDQSGGGAMIDHVVHVADLLKDLLGEEPTTVLASTGNNIYHEKWEDTAVLLLNYPSGVFVTLDSSWSNPQNYKTWGDVTMRVVGTDGVIELDMFGQEIDTYRADKRYGVTSFTSHLDKEMVLEFLRSITEQRTPRVTGADGLAATRVALMGYESLSLKPVPQLV